MGKIKLLIVDDSRVIRERLRTMINDLGNVEITGEAANCTEAKAAIAANAPDCIILDINMPPGNNGMTLLSEIKSAPNAPVIIMLSNYSDNYYRSLCKKSGADYFFDKTTEFEKIPDVLNSAVRL